MNTRIYIKSGMLRLAAFISIVAAGYAGSSAADTMTVADLEGEWFLGGSNLLNDLTWDGAVELDGIGAVTGGVLASSDGYEYALTGGSLGIDSTGRVTGTIIDSDGFTTELTMQMESGKGIMAGEGNSTTVDEDGIFLLIRKYSGFTEGELAGEWFLGGSNLWNDHTWDGAVTLDETGAVTGGVLASSDEYEYTLTGGDLNIDATGTVTAAGISWAEKGIQRRWMRMVSLCLSGSSPDILQANLQASGLLAARISRTPPRGRES